MRPRPLQRGQGIVSVIGRMKPHGTKLVNIFLDGETGMRDTARDGKQNPTKQMKAITGQGQRESQLSEQISIASKNAGSGVELAQALQARLTPVLRSGESEPGEKLNGVVVVPKTQLVEAASRVRDISDQVGRTNDLLQSILDQLEV